MKSAASIGLIFLKENHVSGLIRIAILTLCAVDLFAGASHAYLDPGVGSQALQVGLAGLLGLVFTFRTSFARLVTSLRRKDRS
jgi:hypothetical protein